jgi:hypothetical protein
LASRFSRGSSDGLFGTAQDTSTPSIARRKSTVPFAGLLGVAFGAVRRELVLLAGHLVGVPGARLAQPAQN